MSKKHIFNIVLIIWIVLWILFLIRPSKDGQYAELAYFYSHGYEDNVSFLLGNGLYDYIQFCKENLPAGATYELRGFKEFSIKEVRSRYHLWPLRSVKESPEYVIVYGSEELNRPGYNFYMRSEERRVGKECRSRWSP